MLGSLAKGWPKGQTVPLNDETVAALQCWLPRLSAGGRGKLVQLVSAWGTKGFEKIGAETAKSLMTARLNEKESDTARVNAARQLVEFQPADADLVGKLLEGLTPRSSPQLATGFIEALGTSSAPTPV